MRTWLKVGIVCMGVAVAGPIIGEWTHRKQEWIVPHEHPAHTRYALPPLVWALIASILGGLAVRSVTARFRLVGGSVRSVGARFNVVA
jgi:hypothetical protein